MRPVDRTAMKVAKSMYYHTTKKKRSSADTRFHAMVKIDNPVSAGAFDACLSRTAACGGAGLLWNRQACRATCPEGV